MRKYRLKNKAFTLAELLITLMLIGTIAALTIPDLYLKFEEAYFKSKLMNTLSTLTEATRRMRTDYGGRLSGVLGYDGIGTLKISDSCPAYEFSNPSNSANPDDNIMEMYSRYLNWIQKYPAQSGRTGIVKYKTRSGTNIDESHYPILILTSGVTIAWYDGDIKACESTYQIDEYRAKFPTPCAEYVTLDLNGTKGPNVLGRDVHYFDITPEMVTSSRACVYYSLQQVINRCKTNGNDCAYLWQKGISVY